MGHMAVLENFLLGLVFRNAAVSRDKLEDRSVSGVSKDASEAARFIGDQTRLIQSFSYRFTCSTIYLVEINPEILQKTN
jgi:hypothetical protein